MFNRIIRKALGYYGHRELRSKSRSRLFLKPLEDRTVPALFTVTNTNNSLAGSLRQAIIDSNALAGADTINFAGAVTGTITLTSGEMLISDDLTITGPGASVLKIDGKSAGRVFNINKAGVQLSVSISGLTLTNGKSATLGGAVTVADENVTFTKCDFLNNTASEGGGAITVDGISATQSNIFLTFDGCNLKGNTATSSTGDGGAIDLESSVNVIIKNSTISGNTSKRRGGGVYFRNKGGLLIENSTLSGNSGSDGGAVYFYDRLSETGFTVRNSTISGNSATGYGGGFALSRPNGVFLFQNSTIVNNTSTVKGGGIGTYAYASDTTTRVVIESSIVSGNTSASGPDIFTDATYQPDPLTAANSAIGDISGISTFIDLGGNIAPATPLGLGPLQNNGGQVATHLPIAGSVLINNGRNTAGVINDSRGAGFPRVSGARIDIGAAEVQNDATPTAAASETKISVSGATTQTITVVYVDDGLINFSSLGTGDITVNKTGGGFTVAPTFKNATPSANAATITATYEFTPPGGSWTDDDNGAYTIDIALNQVSDTGAKSVSAGENARFQVGIAREFKVTTDVDGGPGSLRDAVLAANAFFSFGDLVTFDPSLSGKTLLLSGGEIAITEPLTIKGLGSSLLTIDAGMTSRHFNVDGLLPFSVTFSGLTLTKGLSATPGGSINSDVQDLTISKCVLTNNEADSGGAINVAGLRCLQSNVFLTIEDSTVSNNKVTGGGGAFRMSQSANLAIKGSTVSGNTAGGNGGVVYFNRNGSFLVENSTISGNTATGDGGAFYMYESTNANGITVRNSTFSGNKAGGAGGALAFRSDLVTSGTLVIQNSTLTLNSSIGAGGAIAFISPNVKFPINVESSVIAGNTNSTAPDISSANKVTVGFSAIGSNSGFTLTPGAGPNLGFGATLNLGPLQNNGGPTATHFPSPGSPLRNAGSNPFALANDQRGIGFVRVLEGKADIGAVESTDPTPVAQLTASDVIATGATEYTFTVTYSDSNATIDVSTLGTGDITVAGPGGFTATPTFVSVDFATNGTPRIATYRFTPPGGKWDVNSDLGVYTVSAKASEVFDTDAPSKNSVLPGPLGSFQVRFPTTFVVTTNADSGAGSLRQATLDANSNQAPSADSISFSFAGATTITLTTAELLITDSVVITGTGVKVLTVARDALAPQFRIFDVNGPGVINVAISGMTITGGDTAGNAPSESGGGTKGDGGGLLMFNDNITLESVAIVNNKSGAEGGGIGVASVNNANGGGGTLTVRNSTISGNSANGVPPGGSFGGGGGGIYFANGGTLLMENSTVSGNSSTNWIGGGFYLYGNAGIANYTIRNSTISGNTASGNGGGILFYTYGDNPVHSLTVQNSTIAGNSAGAIGGGISRRGTLGTVTLLSTIVADNFAAFSSDLEGDFVADFNLVEDPTGATLNGANNVVGVDPMLLPLADNGGPTLTHKLGATSPAIDAGSNSKLFSTDQRGGGFVRTFNDPGFPNIGDGTDIGALELQPVPAPPTVSAIQVNDGSSQRSMVTSLKVTFSEAVSFPAGILAAFQLNRTANGSLGIVNLSAVQSGNVVTITFVSGGTVGIDPAGSLQDGTYKLTMFADKITGTNGTLDGDGDGISEGNPIDNKSFGVHRLFGDGTGDGAVTSDDFAMFRSVFGVAGPSFDFDGNGVVNSDDFAEFRKRFGLGGYLPPP